MANPFIKKLYSINIKLFLWFWLVTIISIASTKFISEQLAQDVLILPPHPSDQQKLYGAANKIRKSHPKQLIPFLKRIQKHSRALFIIKDLKNNSLYPASTRFNDVLPYLEKNSFSNPTTIKLSNARITGPVDINIKGTKQQLYIVHRDNKRSFNLLVRQLPYWSRILIPVIISFCLCWLLARTLSKPISHMKYVANKFGDGDLSARISHSIKSKDELGELARSFNKMADKIQNNVKAHQRLLGDVSHELRSPMTRLQIAVALAEKSKDKPDILQKHLTRCELEVERLDQMIEDVLSLSRLENSLQNIELHLININDILNPIIEDNLYLAENKKIQINAIIPDACLINADTLLLSSAVNNVLANAVKYSPDNSTVDVTVTTTEKNVYIAISDQGTGVPADALASIFKPFYRTSDARERKAGGTGLGLAIAKQAIVLHGGSINAANNTSGGLSITIALPSI